MTAAQTAGSIQSAIQQQPGEGLPQSWSYSQWRHGGWYVHNVRSQMGDVVA